MSLVVNRFCLWDDFARILPPWLDLDRFEGSFTEYRLFFCCKWNKAKNWIWKERKRERESKQYQAELDVFRANLCLQNKYNKRDVYYQMRNIYFWFSMRCCSMLFYAVLWDAELSLSWRNRWEKFRFFNRWERITESVIWTVLNIDQFIFCPCTVNHMGWVRFQIWSIKQFLLAQSSNNPSYLLFFYCRVRGIRIWRNPKQQNATITIVCKDVNTCLKPLQECPISYKNL